MGCSVLFHEIGHSAAAAVYALKTSTLGIFWALFPGAFVEIDSNDMGKLPPSRQLRVMSGGVAHNLLLFLLAFLTLEVAGLFGFFFHDTSSLSNNPNSPQNHGILHSFDIFVRKAFLVPATTFSKTLDQTRVFAPQILRHSGAFEELTSSVPILSSVVSLSNATRISTVEEWRTALASLSNGFSLVVQSIRTDKIVGPNALLENETGTEAPLAYQAVLPPSLGFIISPTAGDGDDMIQPATATVSITNPFSTSSCCHDIFQYRDFFQAPLDVNGENSEERATTAKPMRLSSNVFPSASYSYFLNQVTLDAVDEKTKNTADSGVQETCFWSSSASSAYSASSHTLLPLSSRINLHPLFNGVISPHTHTADEEALLPHPQLQASHSRTIVDFGSYHCLSSLRSILSTSTERCKDINQCMIPLLSSYSLLEKVQVHPIQLAPSSIQSAHYAFASVIHPFLEAVHRHSIPLAAESSSHSTSRGAALAMSYAATAAAEMEILGALKPRQILFAGSSEELLSAFDLADSSLRPFILTIFEYMMILTDFLIVSLIALVSLVGFLFAYTVSFIQNSVFSAAKALFTSNAHQSLLPLSHSPLVSLWSSFTITTISRSLHTTLDIFLALSAWAQGALQSFSSAALLYMFFQYLATVSLSLALINCAPVLYSDGGQAIEILAIMFAFMHAVELSQSQEALSKALRGEKERDSSQNTVSNSNDFDDIPYSLPQCLISRPWSLWVLSLSFSIVKLLEWVLGKNRDLTKHNPYVLSYWGRRVMKRITQTCQLMVMIGDELLIESGGESVINSLVARHEVKCEKKQRVLREFYRHRYISLSEEALWSLFRLHADNNEAKSMRETQDLHYLQGEFLDASKSHWHSNPVEYKEDGETYAEKEKREEDNPSKKALAFESLCENSIRSRRVEKKTKLTRPLALVAFTGNTLTIDDETKNFNEKYDPSGFVSNRMQLNILQRNHDILSAKYTLKSHKLINICTMMLIFNLIGSLTTVFFPLWHQ